MCKYDRVQCYFHLCFRPLLYLHDSTVHDNVPCERASEQESVCACVCVHRCVFAHVHLHECQSVQGEMLQLPCPKAHETHVMQIYVMFIEAWHATSRAWAISTTKINKLKKKKFK